MILLEKQVEVARGRNIWPFLLRPSSQNSGSQQNETLFLTIMLNLTYNKCWPVREFFLLLALLYVCQNGTHDTEAHNEASEGELINLS